MVVLSLLLLAAVPDAGLLNRPVEISSDTLEIFKKESRAVYRGHAKAIRDSTTVTCDLLTVFTDGKDVSRIEAEGNVLATDGEKTAQGDRATFDNLTGVLTVLGNPRAKSGTRTVEGEEVTFSTGEDRLTVKKARTRAAAEKASGTLPVAIDADLLVLLSKESTATWTGHVKATRDGTTLKAPELTAHYDGAGQVTKVEARGGVEVQDRDRWARGARADFDVPPGILTVTGKPEARQGNNRMKGSRVIFFTGTEKLEVENAVTVLDSRAPGKK